MTNSQDGKSHCPDEDQRLERLVELAKAGEKSDPLSYEYVDSVLREKFDSYVKKLKIAAYEKAPSIREEKLKLDIDISDMKVTPPKLPEGYWK